MNRIRIGNQTSFAVPPLEPFEFAINNDFDAFEWFPDRRGERGWSAGDLDPDMRRYIKEIAHRHDIALAVHAPLKGTIVEWSVDPGASIDARAKVVTLGGVNRVPVVVSAFEGQGAWIDRGQRAVIHVPTLPGTEFVGQVDLFLGFGHGRMI